MTVELLLLASVVLVAFTVEATLGFGATVVTVALASLFMPIDEVLPAFVPLNVVLSGLLAYRGRQHVAGKMLAFEIGPAVAIGMPIGMVLFHVAPERYLKLGFGAFVIALGALELSRRGGGELRKVPRPWALLLLGIGGIAHGAYGTGGPMVVYVAGRELAADKARFRATLSTLWFTLNIVLALSYVLGGSIDRTTLLRTATLAPALILGQWIGERLHARAEGPSFRIAVFAFLTLAGAILVARNV